MASLRVASLAVSALLISSKAAEAGNLSGLAVSLQSGLSEGWNGVCCVVLHAGTAKVGRLGKAVDSWIDEMKAALTVFQGHFGGGDGENRLTTKMLG